MAKKNKQIMSFRIEPDVKHEFENVCGKIGISPSEAISIYLHKVVATQAIPFPVKLDVGNPVYNYESAFPDPKGNPMPYESAFPDPKGKPMPYESVFPNPKGKPMPYESVFPDPKGKPMPYESVFPDPKGKPMPYESAFPDPKGKPDKK